MARIRLAPNPNQEKIPVLTSEYLEKIMADRTHTQANDILRNLDPDERAAMTEQVRTYFRRYKSDEYRAAVQLLSAGIRKHLEKTGVTKAQLSVACGFRGESSVHNILTKHRVAFSAKALERIEAVVPDVKGRDYLVILCQLPLPKGRGLKERD
jgi:hypothetical protein